MASKPAKTHNVKKHTRNKKKMSKPLTALLAILITGVVTVAIVGIYFLIFAVSFVNGEPKINLEEYKQNQDQTTFIYAKGEDGKDIEINRLHGEQNRIWVDYNDTNPEESVIPKNLANAYIALEDKRFRKHNGVDWSRTISASIKNVLLKDKNPTGGSTLTQQLIKNLTGENKRILNRKFYEILAALNLEKNVSKEAILEAYMNTIYMSHGCYGVQTASEKYFGKNVQDLNLAECASLAAITKAPSANDPLKNPEKNRIRQEYCLDMMLQEEMITQEEYDEAMAYKMVFTNSEDFVASDDLESSKNQSQNKIQSYYVDFVIQSVIKDLMNQYGMSKSQASSMIYSGGLRIYSAVDLNVQEAMESIYVNEANFPKPKKGFEDRQSAMTIMDYKGRIVGMVGGVGEKTQNRGLNRAANSVRQPGSSIKPLTIYTPAIENKYVTWSSLVKNYGIDNYYKDGKPGPHNYGGDPGSPTSYVNVQKAICKSYNTVPAQLAKQMGFKKCFNYATQKFHLSNLVDPTDINASSMAVGGTHKGVTTLEMAAAYAAFGNGGMYYEPYCYYKVTNSNGDVLLQKAEEPEGERAMSPETADIMNELLQTVVTDAAGEATARNYGLKNSVLFAKTGTTSEDKDRWFVGGTPYYVGAVWFGCDKQKSISDYVSGNPAGKTFDYVMNKVHKSLKKIDFKKSSPVEQHYYCTRTGLIAGDNCPSKAMGWYSKNNMPGTCVSCASAPQTEPNSAPNTGEAVTNVTPSEAATEAQKPNPDTNNPPVPTPNKPSN